MNKNEKQLFNIEELANNIAKDVAKFTKDVSKVKFTRDLRTLDLSSVIPAAGKSAVRGVISQIKAEGEKVNQQHQEQIQIQSEALEDSIKSRQENLKESLSKIQKAAPEGGSSKTAEVTINENIKSYDRYLEDLHLRKTGSQANTWIEADISEGIETSITGKVTEASNKREVLNKIKPTK